MKHKFWKWVTNAAPDAFGSERTLYLDGQISDETWWGDEVTPKAFKEELNAGSGDIKQEQQQEKQHHQEYFQQEMQEVP